MRNAPRQPVVSVSEKDLFGKPPPKSVEAEMALLGSMILDPRVISDVVTIVKPSEFFGTNHGLIFDAIVEVSDGVKHGEADLVLIFDKLREHGIADEIGGAAYLRELAESVPVATNAAYYARTVAEHAKYRRLVDWASQAIYEVYHATDESRKGLIDRVEQALYAIAHYSESADAESLVELLHREMKRLDENDHKVGLPTGFHDLDRMLGGLVAGEMIILAARPSMGKTALGLGFAEHIAMAGKPVGLFSLEMSKAAITQRLLSARSKVSGSKIRTGAMNDAEYGRVFDAYKAMASAPMFIDDSAALSIMQVRARARRLASKHKIGLIVIDYLQLMTSGGSYRESRQVEVSEISRGIKALARDLNVPVVCLSQLNRASENREGHRPRMSDLRESGSIEQDADVVMLLHREDYYHAGEPEWNENDQRFNPANAEKLNMAEVIVAKQRNGPTGSVELVWDSEHTRFWNKA